VSRPAGFLDPRTVRAYRAAHRAATTLTECRVLDELERCERRHGRATPSVAGTAARIGRSPRTVIRATRALEAAGRLRVVRDRPYRDRAGCWRRARTNLYRVLLPPRNPWSHRGDIADTSIAPSGGDSAPGTARAAVATGPAPPLFDPDHPPGPLVGPPADLLAAVRAGRCAEIYR